MSIRTAVMGTGGVGGYFGARLAAAGEDVTFIARGAHLEAIRRDGLVVESPLGGARIAPAKATADPAEVGTVDAVIFAVKLVDVDSAAEAVRPLVGPDTAVFTFQNGIESADRVGRILGADRVVPGVAYIATVIAGPGRIRHSGSMARIVFGERHGRPSERVGRFHAACAKAGINAEISPNVMQAIWRKFAFLAPFSGLTALTRLPAGALRANAQSRALIEQAVAEVVAVSQAAGTGLDADDVAATMKLIDGIGAEMISSMYHDLSAGKRLELDGLSGAVVRLGERHGVPTPAHLFMVQALSPHAGGRGGV